MELRPEQSFRLLVFPLPEISFCSFFSPREMTLSSSKGNFCVLLSRVLGVVRSACEPACRALRQRFCTRGIRESGFR